jgi:hypothetical protein
MALTSSAASRTGEILAIDRIVAIHRLIPNTHLVMHGSSSVPQEWLAVIREHGGEIPVTYGVPVEEIQRGIAQWRAQGEYRYRYQARDERRDAQVAGNARRPSSIRAPR